MVRIIPINDVEMEIRERLGRAISGSPRGLYVGPVNLEIYQEHFEGFDYLSAYLLARENGHDMFFSKLKSSVYRLQAAKIPAERSGSASGVDSSLLAKISDILMTESRKVEAVSTESYEEAARLRQKEQKLCLELRGCFGIDPKDAA